MPSSWYMILAQTPDHLSSGNSSVVTLSYIIGSITAIAGIIGGLHRFYNRQKKRWIEDGETRAREAQLLKEQTKAISDLTRKFDDFTNQMNREFSEIRLRVNHLEKRRPSGAQQ